MLYQNIIKTVKMVKDFCLDFIFRFKIKLIKNLEALFLWVDLFLIKKNYKLCEIFLSYCVWTMLNLCN